MEELVRVRREGEVALVLLNRPQKFNAFDSEMVQQFSTSLITLAVEEGVKGLAGF